MKNLKIIYQEIEICRASNCSIRTLKMCKDKKTTPLEFWRKNKCNIEGLKMLAPWNHSYDHYWRISLKKTCKTRVIWEIIKWGIQEKQEGKKVPMQQLWGSLRAFQIEEGGWRDGADIFLRKKKLKTCHLFPLFGILENRLHIDNYLKHWESLFFFSN